MTQSTKIQWHRVFLVAFGMLVLLVLAHVLFVAYYSHLMDPAHDQAYYSEFAQNTGAPFVFFFAPLPIFLLVRWVGKKDPSRALVHAVLITVVALVLDVTIVALAGKAASFLTPGILLAHIAKIVAGLWGGWTAKQEWGFAN